MTPIEQVIMELTRDARSEMVVCAEGYQVAVHLRRVADGKWSDQISTPNQVAPTLEKAMVALVAYLVREDGPNAHPVHLRWSRIACAAVKVHRADIGSQGEAQ